MLGHLGIEGEQWGRYNLHRDIYIYIYSNPGVDRISKFQQILTNTWISLKMPYSFCLRMVIYHQWYILFTGRYRLYSVLADKPESSRQHYAHYANLWLRLTMGYIMIYPGAFSCLIGNCRFSHVFIFRGFHKWWYPHSWMVYNGK